MKLNRLSILAGALLGTLALANMASAATIAFTTTLLGGPINLGSGVTVSYTAADPLTTSFDTSVAPYNSSPFAVDYGSFAINLPSNLVNVSVSSQQYTIQVSVSQPFVVGGPNQTPTVVGDITGSFKTVKVRNQTTGQDTLQFLFDPSSDTIGPLTYDDAGIGTITWTFESTNIGSSGVHSTYGGDMLGTVAYTPYTGPGPTVPLPASVLSGSALLGAIFIAKARSRKNKA